MNSFFRAPAVLVLTVLLPGGVIAQTSIDSTLQTVRSLYTSGAYTQAELEARRVLDNDLVGDSLRTMAEQWVAFALVAQARPAMAREHFLTILRRQPSYDLDPILTSPKILTVFNEARAAYRAARPTTPPKVEQLQPGGISFRTILFPGWEQMYQGRPTPGAVFLGAGIATLGTGIALEFVRSNARTRYLGATQAAEIESRYQTYNRAQKAEAWAFAAFAVLYLASEIDVFTNSASLSIGPAEHSASNGGVQMTLSLR